MQQHLDLTHRTPSGNHRFRSWKDALLFHIRSTTAMSLFSGLSAAGKLAKLNRSQKKGYANKLAKLSNYASMLIILHPRKTSWL